MATGFLVGESCFDTLPDAINAYFTKQPVVTYPDPVTPPNYFTQQYVFASGVGWSNVVSNFQPPLPAPLLISSVSAVVPAFPACYSSSESFNDGVASGGAFSLILIFAFSTVAVVRVLR